jgi:hypothetical protein
LKVNPSGKRRAISGILASVIFFSMLFSAGLGFILFTFNSYNNYDRAQVGALQAAQAKSLEGLQLRSCDTTAFKLPANPPYTPPGCSVGSDVGVWVQNIGSAAVSIVGMWVYDSVANTIVISPTNTHGAFASPYAIGSGAAITIDIGQSLGSSNYAITFLTGLGNQFTATYPPPLLPNSGPSISLNPPYGPVGTTVTITGTGFAAASTITLKFDSATMTSACPSPGLCLSPASVTTTAAGGFTAHFTVPTTSDGPHAVQATDASANAASAVFTVTAPTLALSPNSGPVLTAVDITGTSFTPSSTVSLTFQGSSWGSCGTDAAGNIGSPCSFAVPGSAATGFNTVTGTDLAGLRATAIFDVTTSSTSPLPAITINPLVGLIGTTVTISGIQFAASKLMTFTFDGAALTTVPASVTTTAGGAFPSSGTVTFTVPAAIAGPHTVRATDASSNTATALFTVAVPAITINPVEGPVGTVVTVTGANFAPTSGMTFRFDAVVLTTVPPSVTTNAGGSFSGITSAVPASASGPHSVTATDSSGNAAVAIFTSIAPAIVLTPISGVNGAVVTVTGTNFAASKTVTFTWDGSPLTTVPASVTTTAGGAFPSSGTVTFTTPSSASAGPHTVTATDASGGTASAIFTINCATSTTCVAASAFGLGYISFDFNTFQFYTGSTCTVGNYPATGCQLTSQGLAYTIPQAYDGGYLAFSVQFKNVDPNGRTLIFDDQSIMQAAVLCESSGCGSITTPVWKIGTVNSANQVQAWNGSISLKFGQTKTFWFIHDASGSPGFGKSCAGGTCFYETPIFFDVHGTICATPPCGTTFGENLPFTTMYWPTSATPGIILSPISGIYGTVVTVTGSGYASTSTITIKYDGVTQTTTPATVTTSATGTFSATFTVPDSTAGSHTVSATDASSNTASAAYTLTMGIVLNPVSGHVGTIVTVAGSGYAATSTITIKYDGVVQSTTPATVNSSAFGSFSATFTVPASTAGSHTVSATDASSNTASAFFTVTPSISLAPASGNVGSSVTVTGAGFASTSTTTLKYNGVTQTTIPATITTNAAGGFSASFNVPPLSVGANTVTATDVSANTASATFTVTKALEPNVNSQKINTVGSVTSTTLTISTNTGSDLIYACEYTENSGLTYTISDTALSTWTSRHAALSNAHANSGEMQCWYAIPANALANDVITFGSSAASGGTMVVVMSVTGVNTVTPFDPGVASAITNQGHATSTSGTGMTTTNANDVIIGIVGTSANRVISTSAGFTSDSTISAVPSGAAEYQVVASTGTYTPTFSWPSADYFVTFADAIDPPAQASNVAAAGAPASANWLNLAPSFMLIALLGVSEISRPAMSGGRPVSKENYHQHPSRRFSISRT